MEIVFAPPAGKAIQNPSLEMLRDLVFQYEQNYWRRGSGDAKLYAAKRPLYRDGALASGRAIALMGLSFKEPYGFHVSHSFSGEDDYVAISSHDYTETAELILEGNPWNIPVAFFVPREAAWDAVQEFIESGTRSAKLEWVKLCEQVWGGETTKRNESGL